MLNPGGVAAPTSGEIRVSGKWMKSNFDTNSDLLMKHLVHGVLKL